MKNYYCYNHTNQLVGTFDTQEQGKAWIDEQIKQWRQLGRKGLVYRLCYNGFKSVEVYNAKS